MKSNYQGDSREEEVAEQRQFNVRLNLFFFSAFAIFTIIIVQLANLQFVEGPSLTKKQGNPLVKDVPLSPMRGSILDATGAKLAYSTPVQSLYVTLSKSSYDESKESGKKNRAEAVKLAESLVKVFEENAVDGAETMTVDKVVEAMDLEFKKNNGFTPRRIKIGLNAPEIAYLMEHKADYPGVEVVEETVRNYDKDTVAVQAIGYIKKYKGASTSLQKYKDIRASNTNDPALQYTETEDVGYDGLEFMYQDELRGKNGFKSVSIDPRNMANGIPEITAPEKGLDVHTTLNKNIQLITEQAILDQIVWSHSNSVNGRLHPKVQTGYAVAMEIDTGNIVAMASMPDYDTNVWQSGSIPQEDWEKIQTNYQNGTITPYSSGKSGDNLESVVLMGSTIKPLSVLIGLNEGLFGLGSTYSDRGVAYFGKNDTARVRNSEGHVYGTLTPARAIEKSSNAFMVDMVGEKLYNKYGSGGVEIWDTYMKQFGLGVSTGIDLPNEYLGNREYIHEQQVGSALSALAYASFGQQGKYTVMQLAQYTTMLATKGKRMEPHLVSKITDSSGNIVKKFEPNVLNEVNFDDRYWKEIIKGMNSNVGAFSGFPYDYARKTGTSTQTVYTKEGRKEVDNGVFIAFAPRENPKLAVAVVIPQAGFGGQSAAPVARKIFDAYDWEYGLDGVPKKNKQTQTNDTADSTSSEQ